MPMEARAGHIIKKRVKLHVSASRTAERGSREAPDVHDECGRAGFTMRSYAIAPTTLGILALVAVT